MSRTRKVLSLSTKNYSKARREKAEYAESLIKGGDRDGLELDEVRDELVDDIAAEEYVKALEELRKLDFVCNLDKGNLIAYANAASLYRKCTERMKADDFQLVTSNKMGERSNPILQIRERAYLEMCRAGEKLGMSVSARLKAADFKVNKEEDELKSAFGDI